MHALFDSLPAAAPARPVRIALLHDHAVIAARGPDAASFLHAQLTQSVQDLDSQARPAGYCTAKGRLLASMVIWRDAPGEAVYALVRRDVAEPLVKRLSMFVLRAKVKLSVEPLAVAGLWCDAADGAGLAAAVGSALPDRPWQRADLPSGTWIGAPAADTAQQRWWWIADSAQAAQAEGLRERLAAGDAQAWAGADLAAGLPWVQVHIQDLFIPQTVNLDLIGGVSFDKGCYPGQEVVARSHYRGTLKRRMAYGIADGAAEPAAQAGADLYEAGRPEPCGRVVNAAPGPQGVALLFETTFDALARGALRLGSPDGTPVQVGTLPYDVPVPA